MLQITMFSGSILKKKAQVSLKQIAEATNLSITTVSRALRGQGEISAETRQKVLNIAKELNYRPNLLIQGIQTGRTGNIGVMVPPFNPYWTEVLKGIHDKLAEEDFAPITLWDDSDTTSSDKESFMLKQMHRLIDRRVDGVILWPRVSEVYGAHLDELKSRELPVVTIDHELPFSSSVTTDEKLGANLVAEHLYHLGHRRIGHLAGDPHWTWARLRRQYFEQSLSRYPDTQCLTVIGSDSAKDIPSAAKELLTAEPRPTAIFACSDWVAFEIYTVAREMGIRIPTELSIVGYSDTHKLSQFITPPLTTIRQHPNKIGWTAAALMVDSLNSESGTQMKKNIDIECELTVRESTQRI